jgi:cell division septation protein DedD
MPKNEDGEFELILGNRQLLSVFFIVVVLLGVFFTMGYIVGRNSGPVATADATPVHRDAKPLVVDSATPTPTPAAEAPPPRETAPQQPTPSPKPAEVTKKEPPKPTPPPAAAPAATGDAPAAGQTYLQLAATSQHEADIEIDVLRKKGFKAIAMEIPEHPGTFRVLVGPIGEGGINKMKSDLDAAGFPGDRSIRRTF